MTMRAVLLLGQTALLASAVLENQREKIEASRVSGFVRTKAKLQALAKSFGLLQGDQGALVDRTGFCYIPTLRVVGNFLEAPVPEDAFQEGSGTRIFLVDQRLGGGKLVMKIADLNHPKAVADLVSEKAFVSAMRGCKYIPRMYQAANLKGECRLVTLVTDFGGSHSLKNFPEPLTLSAAAAIATKVLDMLWSIHDRGFVHGDVHAGNFVFEDFSRVVETLRIVDFGRAEPFVDEAGYHLPPRTKWYGDDYGPLILSPFELTGSRKSRRDDLFRLAEMLLLLTGNDRIISEKYQQARSDIFNKIIADESLEERVKRRFRDMRRAAFELKLNREFDSGTPDILKRFYSYCLYLGFQDRPKYETWIREFSAARNDQ